MKICTISIRWSTMILSVAVALLWRASCLATADRDYLAGQLDKQIRAHNALVTELRDRGIVEIEP